MLPLYFCNLFIYDVIISRLKMGKVKNDNIFYSANVFFFRRICHSHNVFQIGDLLSPDCKEKRDEYFEVTYRCIV